MWNYDDQDEQTSVEVARARAVIGTIYLVLGGRC
jgi:hypothetical protein